MVFRTWCLHDTFYPYLNEPIDEIIAYWYPSHESLLSTRGSAITKENFEIRQELVEYAIIHRVNGDNPPLLPKQLD